MEIPLQVQRTLFNKENFTTFCYQQCTTTNYILFIFSQVKIEYNKGWLYSGGASLLRRIIILQALTRLNFFDFQIFENLSFNDFSIVIENLPESNGYIFLSMTWKFWRFLTLDQTTQSIWAHRDPTPTSSRTFSILSTHQAYCMIHIIWRHFLRR